MNGGRALLEAKNIQVSRGGVRVLDVPALTVYRGEVLSLIGPNGAGKTTLLQTLARLTKMSSGELIFGDELIPPTEGAVDYRRRLAMVFQETLLFNTTVFDNVASGLKIR
ncbi:MAG TPA: ATP-binding cassette domain-containing protein, partial [Thermodesulfobacteriota bacterium]|nr:ATP-binding cassette domain-containing protein [Thermodesulfobacteriota bacterium]